MPSTKRRNAMGSALQRASLRQERLRLIKRRHRELILKPRDGLMQNCFEGDDAFLEFEEQDELALLDSYGLRARL